MVNTAFDGQASLSDEEWADENEDQELRILESLGETILVKRGEAIEGRVSSGVERRWREDEDAFAGLDDTNKKLSMIDYAIGEGPVTGTKDPNRSQVVINIVRSKCETAEGRFSDILLPVDDRNWGLKTTPVPEMVKGLKDNTPAIRKDGAPLINPETKRQATNAEAFKAKKDDIKERMKQMELEIDDQLNECGYNGECRKIVKDAVRLGTGILKGPNIVKNLKKVWEPQTDESGTAHVLKVEEDFQPASKRVDPWNVYPDPNCGEEIKRASYIWERDFILPREVRDLIGVEGYREGQLRKVLEEDPKRLNVSINRQNHLEVRFDAINKGKAYERWEYYGDIDREDLEAIGVDCSGDTIGSQSLSGCIVFINDHPVKVMLNTLDAGDVPYDFFQWTQQTGSPWGIGISRILVWLSRIIISAWRAMMDNAGDSAGANIVVSNDIEPGDGKWEVTGRKIWRALGEVADVSKAWAQFQVKNNQKDLEAVIELALKFVDMETSLPMLFQGEKGETPETLGATNIMVDANNVGLRPRVKVWDDNITRPHLTRYYHWNMQYNAKPEIKGDYKVDARGTSELLAKDQMVMRLIPIMKLRQDPFFAGRIDWDKATKQLTSAQHLDILKSDDDYKAWQEEQKKKKPPQDPRIAAATIRAQADIQKVQEISRFDTEKIKFQEEIAQKDRQHELNLKIMDYRIKLMEYSEKRNIGLDKVKADLAAASKKLDVQVMLAKSDAKGPEIIKPPVEPAGRAKEGRAFPD